MYFLFHIFLTFVVSQYIYIYLITALKDTSHVSHTQNTYTMDLKRIRRYVHSVLKGLS